MSAVIAVVLRIIRTVFAAEFVSGFVHWVEDAYIREDTPVVGRSLARPNIAHHHYPRHMTKNSWWQSS